MKKFLFPFFALALSLASCQSDIDILNVQPEFETPVFTASIEEETRTNLSLNDNSWKILWVDTDRLSVFSKSDHNLRYKVSSITNNGTYADFVYMKEYVRGSGVNYSYNYSAYPYYKTTKLVDECIQMDIPSTQYYVEGDDMYYVPMVAKSPTLNLKFKAPSSVLNIAMNKEDNPNEFKLMSVTVSSSSVDLAGRVSIDMSGDTFVAHIDPSLGDTSKSVTLDLGEGVELTTDIKNFPIALPEVVFPENDFVVTCRLMVSGEERVLKVTRDKSLTFEGGRVKRLTVNVKTDSFFGNGGGEIDGEINIEDDMILDEPLVVPSGGSASINLNGTVSLLPTNTNSSLVVVEEGGELTIDGEGEMTTVVAEPTASALSATRAASNTAFPIVVNGTLRIKGGRFTLNSYATSWLNCGIYVGPKGKLIIEGGRFHSPKGSFIFGHEHGNRPEIIIHGGRFEGFDPSDNDFDGNGSNYLEPEYASYYVAENELVVAERTANWEVDNNYLLNSILKNGGNATLIDSVHDTWAFNVDNNINVNYPVNISVSGDPSKLSAECRLYFDTPINCYADVNIKGDSYDPNMLYIDSIEAIANVYNGATLTLGEAKYFGGGDEVTETLFNLYGGNIVVNDGSYTLSERINAANMFVIDSRYAEESSLVVNGGVFYGFDPSAVTVGEEVKSYVAEGLSAYEVSQLEYGIYPTGSAFDVDNFYLLRSIFKNGGRANISGKVSFEESLVALNPVVLNMGSAYANELNYSGDDAMMKCYSDVSLIADVNNDQPYVYSSSVVAEVYENVKFEVNMYNGIVTNTANNAMFVANGGQIDIYSGMFTAPGGFLENEELANSEISVYGGTYYNFNPEAFVGEGYAVKDSDGYYYEVYPVTF